MSIQTDVETKACAECKQVKPLTDFYPRNLKREYGLTVADYKALAEAQGGRCAVCRGEGEHVGAKTVRLVVDHDHETGRARGLLCDDCNMGLGRFRDDPVRLLAAADYLIGQVS